MPDVDYLDKETDMNRIPDPALALLCGAFLGCLCAAFV